MLVSYKTFIKIFQPIISRIEKEDKIKRRLALLEKYKAIFILPSNIHEATLKEKFDAAIHDYKKGKALMAELDPSLRIKFDKVWIKVGKQIDNLKSILYSKLISVGNVEIQEKCIAYLLELDPNEDPITFYVKQVEKDAIENLERISLKAKKSIENLKDSMEERTFSSFEEILKFFWLDTSLKSIESDSICNV